MKGKFREKEQRRGIVRQNLQNIMKCHCSGGQLALDEMVPSSESLATKDYSLGDYSSKNGEACQKPDTRNIEEAELTLREHGSLNYEVCSSNNVF
uniref:Tetratricopeptide repeat protein 7A isoform X2 n=1 Tax=Rhizophora mucronata TaxID=61149 RepID=A0A2P2K4V9_RHIMU